MKMKKKIILGSVISCLFLSTATLCIASCANNSHLIKDMEKLFVAMEQWYKQTSDKHKSMIANKYYAEAKKIKNNFDEAKTDLERKYFIDEMIKLYDKAQKSQEPDNLAHVPQDQPPEGELVNKTEDDIRFTNNGKKWLASKLAYPNQFLIGQILGPNENYDGLMIYNWTAKINWNEALPHTHSHSYLKLELERVENQIDEGFKIVEAKDKNLRIIIKKDAQTGMKKAIMPNTLIRTTELDGIRQTGFDSIMLRFDGIGTSSDIVSIYKDEKRTEDKLERSIDRLYPPYIMDFELPVDYVQNKSSILLTAISFEHMHGINIGNQWTIQFKTPIEIIIETVE
ncbi:hypothetical protein OF376_00810 [Ureaplasma miroungigenitalium]|uniref:Lipoprotein n=1 Tax=Ureaplasma miroungigenitalium TaxID=1042321 RepID=A0ABT3BM54_9BACT|nr:hypothetical protein [Ureaplasma miroungigenitalium]MCV3728329.1 hypothetical protein [Ureaplasma miroungigenitalium]